jgi:hypothetical protein
MEEKQVRAQLRAALIADHESWHAILEDILCDLEKSPTQLQHTLELVVQKRPETGPKYRPRLDKIVEEITGRLRSLSSNAKLMRDLATDIDSLEKQKVDIESKLLDAKEKVGAILGPNAGLAVGDLLIKTGPQGTSLKVEDPSRLSPAFFKEQPDRKAILNHYRETGEVVPGTTVSRLRPSVRVIPRGPD